MRHTFRKLSILATFALILGMSQTVLAAGTPAWTVITNTASLTYSVGGVVQADTPTGSVNITVDRKVAFSVSSVANTSTTPGATAQALAFQITNDGNAPLDFDLDAINLGGDIYNAAILDVYAETDGTAGYNTTNDTGTFVDYLMPDDNIVVYVVSDIPTTSDGSTALVSNNNAIVQFTATAYNSAWADGNANGIPDAGEGNSSLDGALPDHSATDNANDTVETVVINATASAQGEYIITAAQVSVTKTVSVVSDPTGAVAPLAKAIPGATLEYTITVENTGTVDIESVKLSDPIPTNTAYVAGSTKLDGVAQTDAAGPTSPMAAGTGLDLGIITKAGGADPDKVVTFQVTIN